MPRSLAAPQKDERESKDLKVVEPVPREKVSLRRRFLDRLTKHKASSTQHRYFPTDLSEDMPVVNDQKTGSETQLQRPLSYEGQLIYTKARDVWLPLDPSVSPSDPSFKVA
ncbi:hypothetical protein Slin15195_G034260 [Septoria linicola]|uniref:Uncharacterized protein n=1 Tax=Septoria linicola TaxID=215465 RepID=A0A9Q9AIU5_9PEZI|nr:hypothetical protein Slin15195_G034260 [Septoria linicola]